VANIRLQCLTKVTNQLSITLGSLWQGIAACARVLHVSIEYFFGTDSDAKQPQYNKAVLTVAAEIMALPNDDIRKSVYHLARNINKTWDAQDNVEVARSSKTA
jgi:hypothetical protein